MSQKRPTKLRPPANAGALAAVAMAFAGAAFAGGPGINLPAPALQEGFSIHGLIDTGFQIHHANGTTCLLYTSPSPRDGLLSRMPSSA